MTQVIYQPLVGYNELLKTIDNGGFYEVKQAVRLLTAFFAYFTHLNACVLLFCDLTRIALEMKAMKDLHHEHICRLYQIIETNEYYFLILENIANITSLHIDDVDQLCHLLEQSIKYNSQLKYKEKSRYICDALIENDWGKFVFEFN
ncbi:unnamed protein product [Rotaria socialis]|uniref:Protein kinase domain-containing protein n=2 Tax=Rotaria socialis TaxID=392032 RepID=A0A821CE43_9BILA|nr:unnamed protein product [Rotaria socialis]